MAGCGSNCSAGCCKDFSSRAERLPNLLSVEVTGEIFAKAVRNMTLRAAQRAAGMMSDEEYEEAKSKLVRWLVNAFSGENPHYEADSEWHGNYSDVGDFEDIFETFRLDYDNTPYHSTDKSYWKIEFKTTNKELKKINLDNTYGYELGGNNTLPDPCTQNAFTGSKNGKVIPEWNLEKAVKYRKDSLITKIERGRMVEQYKFNDGIWRKVK